MERERMNNDMVRIIAGVVTAAGVLAAQHWFPYWRPLKKLEAYTLGTATLLLGGGIATGFSADWRRIAIVTAVGGLTVIGAHRFDVDANARARKHAGVGDGKRNQT
jgi:hypothetical protein